MHRHPRRRKTPVLALGVVAAVALAFPVVTAANSVPVTRAVEHVRAITPDDLKPAVCSTITVTNIVIGSNGTRDNDLLLGSPGLDNMNGRQGDDCILAGGGTDRIAGAQGVDVCVGGPDPDIFNRSCETAID